MSKEKLKILTQLLTSEPNNTLLM